MHLMQEAYIPLIERLYNLGEIRQGTSQPIHFVDDYSVDLV
jgi:hypothetical protein